MAGKKKRKNKGRLKAEKVVEQFIDWIKKQNPKDLAELALMGGLAYAGYEAFKDWKGALLGPVSYKLATAPGGTPPVAQITGVAGLTTLGLALSSEFIGDMIRPAFSLADVWAPDRDVKAIPPWDKCPDGYIHTGHGVFWKICTKIKEPEK